MCSMVTEDLLFPAHDKRNRFFVAVLRTASQNDNKKKRGGSETRPYDYYRGVRDTPLNICSL